MIIVKCIHSQILTRIIYVLKSYRENLKRVIETLVYEEVTQHSTLIVGLQ